MKKKDTNSYIYVLVDKDNYDMDTWGYYTNIESAMEDKKLLEDHHRNMRNPPKYEIRVIECYSKSFWKNELQRLPKPKSSKWKFGKII